MKTLAKVVVCMLLVAGFAYAQGVGASGSITGTVTDPSGAVLTNANVTVTQAERAIRRTAVSDATGRYSVLSLPPATYDISIEHAGFQTMVQKGVVVNVGQTVVLDFQMKVSAAAETVEVTTEPPLVETERSSQADTVNQQYIQDLPINRRDYLTFTLLMPGVSDSTRLASDQDFRVRQTPQSGLSFYGSNGRGNNVTVDGGEANDDAGGVRLTVSQEAVQEFQINRSNYSPEFGAASGAAVNIVTKAGTNDVHGSLFAFFRNDRFDARNPLAIGPALAPGQTFFPLLPDSQGTAVKDKLSRQQFGGSVGFSTNKDKSFFYLAYEGLRNSDQSPVPLLINTETLRPTLQQRAIIAQLTALGPTIVPCISTPPTALPAAICAQVMTNALTVSQFNGLTAGQLARNAFVIKQLENNGGLVPFSDGSDLGLFRFDHRFSDRNHVFVRFNAGRDDSHNPNTQALTGLSRGDVTSAFDTTVLASWFHVFSPTKLNELRVQWNLSHFDVNSNDTLGPGLDINGYANLGRNIFLPSFTTMRRYDFADNFSFIHGRHTIKFGGDFLLRGNKSESHTFLGGRFVFGPLPGGLVFPCLQVPLACSVNAPPTTLNSLQGFSFGLPQFYQQGFGSPTVTSDNPFFAGYVQDTFAWRSNLTFTFGLRYELDQRYAPLNTDHDNFAPRASFAWDPWKDHKTVVRGGYGIFYSPTYYQIDYVVRALGIVNGFRQIAQVFVPLSPAPVNAASIFQTLFAQGVIQQINCNPSLGDGCITPANLVQFGIPITHTGPIPPLSVIFGGQPDYQNPYSQQAEIGIEREIFPGWSVAGTFIYAHTLRLPRSIDANLLPTAPITPGPTGIPFQNWAGPGCPALCFANPLILQNNIYSSNAAALYHAGIFELKKRFSNHYSILASYTYSKAKDDSTDYNSDYAAFNEVNLAAERSLSDFDQRHKVVVAAVLESPWKGGSGASTFNRIFSGFTLSPIFRYNSGHPWNLLVGSDINGDRHATNDRPFGAGRNTGKGPNYFSWDMRLSREFKFGDRASFQLIAEGFNILNRQNLASVNNVVGLIPPPFNLSGAFLPGGSGTCANAPYAGFVPNNPCTFTAANPARQVQIGLHFSF